MSTDWSGSVRGAGPVFLAALVLQGLLGWVGARSYLTNHNTLLANGHWTSTKIELERGLNGSYGFIHGRQSLAGGRLNLGAWHGFQEVLWNQEVENLRSLEFDFELKRQGWLAVVLNRGNSGGSYNAVLFGGARNRVSALLEVSEQGRFLGRRPLAWPTFSSDAAHHARIEIGGGRLTVSVDGEELGSFDHDSRLRQQFGFRGGLRPALVDNVVARFGSDRIARDSFDSPPGAWRLTTALILVLVLINVAVFVLLAAKLEISRRHLGFYFLMINLTLLVIGVFAYLFAAERSAWYPGLNRSLEEKEAYFLKGESARVERQVGDRFAALAGQHVYRILFVGSSQTWGAGARHAAETFVSQLEGLLDSGQPGAPRFACINGGISSTRATDLLPLLERWLAVGKPEMVVINLSSNDMNSPPGEFEGAVRAMVERALATGALPVLIKEPRIFVERGLSRNHETLDRIAGDYRIPALHLQRFLQRANHTGFLWWDKVHLTSYGQTLVAAHLHDELIHLIGREAQPASRSGDG